jgi:uncharacterized membrane protein
MDPRFPLFNIVMKFVFCLMGLMLTGCVVAWAASEFGAAWPHSPMTYDVVWYAAFIMAGPVPIVMALAGLTDIAFAD